MDSSSGQPRISTKEKYGGILGSGFFFSTHSSHSFLELFLKTLDILIFFYNSRTIRCKNICEIKKY